MHITQRTLGIQSLCCLDFMLCNCNMDHVYLPKAKYQHPSVIPQAPNRHLLGTTYTRHRGPEQSQHTKHVCDTVTEVIARSWICTQKSTNWAP